VSALESELEELLEIGLAHSVSTALEPLFGPSNIAITPYFSIGSGINFNDPLVDSWQFRASPVIILDRSSDNEGPVIILDRSSNNEVLALCVSVQGGLESINAQSVNSFLGTKSFGYFVTDSVLGPVIRLRWRRLDLPDRFVDELPVDLTNPDDPEQTFRGRALIRITLQPTEPTPTLVDADGEMSDPLQLLCEQEVQLLNLRDEDNEQVRDIDDLKTPTAIPLVWRIDLFTLNPGPGGIAGAFYKSIATSLLSPLYAPFFGSAALGATRLRDIDGSSLCTKGWVFVRGEMSSE
jgi:hypothetical protein